MDFGPAFPGPLPPITRNQPRVPNLRCNCTIQAGYSQRKPRISGNPGQETGFPENSREKGPKQAGPEGPEQGNRSPIRARMGVFAWKRGMRHPRIEKRSPEVFRRRGFCDDRSHPGTPAYLFRSPWCPGFPSHRVQELATRGKGGVTQIRGGGLPGDPPVIIFYFGGTPLHSITNRIQRRCHGGG